MQTCGIIHNVNKNNNQPKKEQIAICSFFLPLIGRKGKMKPFKTNAICPKCGKLLRTTDIPEYAFVCLECDENFYSIEVQDYSGERFEVSAECTETMFSQNLEGFQKLKPEPDFIGYDTEEHLADFGFPRILTSEEIIPLVQTLENLLLPETNATATISNLTGKE